MYTKEKLINTKSNIQTKKLLFFQPKLTINQPNDAYEQEADAMADEVMRMPDSETNNNSFFKPAISSIQRKCKECEEEEKHTQRKEMDTSTKTADASTENYISSLSGKGRPLTRAERTFFEPRFGYDFSNVRLHTDSVAAKSAQSINALAYTTGNDIVFNEGQYNPGADNSKRLLGHELTHVVQQGGAAIKRASTCPASSCPGIAPSPANCSAYWANSWWLPNAYANNATLACLETPNEPTANCVRKTLQDRLAATPASVKTSVATQKGLEASANPVDTARYKSFVISTITPMVYGDHVFAYRTAGCPSGPASYPAWIGVTTVPMPAGTVGLSIRWGGGSCSGSLGSWC